jgi:hypothetical protein
VTGGPTQRSVIQTISAGTIIVQPAPARVAAPGRRQAAVHRPAPQPTLPPEVAQPPQARSYDVRLGLLMQSWPGEEPFGALTPFARAVSTLARPDDVDVVVFSPEDVDLARKRVRVRRWLGADAGWIQGEAPLPDVVWNRYFRRDQEGLIQALQAEAIPFINGEQLNKWEAYKCLTACDGRIREHLPYTRLLSQASTVLEMLEDNPVVYIKPVSGSVGRGIIQARREGPRVMRLAYVSRETGAVRETYATEEQFDRWLEAGGRTGRCIAQQGLQLNVFHGRPADVRVLVQKDGAGLWQVTGMACRVAGQGRFTANLHTGGQGVPVEALAEAVFPESAARQMAVLNQLEELSLLAASCVEGCTGLLGELGLDFGIDHRGQIWCIEQNWLPGRSIFEHLGRWDLSDLAHLRPVQYARYLVKTATSQPARKTPAREAT